MDQEKLNKRVEETKELLTRYVKSMHLDDATIVVDDEGDYPSVIIEGAGIYVDVKPVSRASFDDILAPESVEFTVGVVYGIPGSYDEPPSQDSEEVGVAKTWDELLHFVGGIIADERAQGLLEHWTWEQEQIN